MISLLFVMVVAIFLGIVAGLMPGLGTTMVLIIVYPILKELTVIEVFFFYLVLDSTMQYYGSVSSIVFGVMGESTSAPAVMNGHALFRRGEGDMALTATATSSFVASLFGILVFWLCAEYSSILTSLLTGKIKAIILISVLLVISVTSSNFLLSLVMIVLGLVAGSAGDNILGWSRFIFPHYSMFDSGIPAAAMLTGFIAIPSLLEFNKANSTLNFHQQNRMLAITPTDRIKYLLNIKHFASTFRGSVIGCICGVIPGVSYSISSNLAEVVEKRLNKKSDTTDALTKNLLAAESANNSGAIVVLAPLILLMIPIVPSESIVLGLVESRGFTYANGLAFISAHLYYILTSLVTVNLINWLMSGYCYRYIANAYFYSYKYIYLIALAGCAAITLVTGYFEFHFLLSVIVLVVSIAAGLAVRSISVKMAFVFAFFVSGDIVIELYRQYLIYS